jgi:hypothetical protein
VCWSDSSFSLVAVGGCRHRSIDIVIVVVWITAVTVFEIRQRH